MSKHKKKEKRKDKHKERKKHKSEHKSSIKKSKHKSRKEKHLKKHSSGSESDSSSSSSSAGARRSVVTGKKLKLERHANAAEEARREAIREQMNGGEVFGSALPAAPKSSFERAVEEKLKDKEGMQKMMLAKAEHAKFQLATGVRWPVS